MTQLTAGNPEPLGARFDGKGVNFTLFSAHAERVELCVFDGEGNEHRYDLPSRTGDIWHGYLSGGRPGMHYGFRVHGAWEPSLGHWFNPAKLLIDPCAHRVDGEFKDDPIFHVGYGEPDHRDSAKKRGGERPLRLGRRCPAAHAVGQYRHLRSACERADVSAPVNPQRDARDL